MFGDYVSVLYSISYAIKMGLKKREIQPAGYMDYTVYPLEGIWDIREEAKKQNEGSFSKDDLVFHLMIRQPDFVEEDLFDEMLEITRKKKHHPLLDKVNFEKIEEGKCIQVMHLGSFGQRTCQLCANGGICQCTRTETAFQKTPGDIPF